MQKNVHSNWVLENNTHNNESHLHVAPVFTVGNGLVCLRGFWEEEQGGIAGLGGIYMAEVFGRGNYQPWDGEGHELVNLPNFLWMNISVNGCPLVLEQENIEGFYRRLKMDTGVFERGYVYKKDGIPLVRFAFSRFASYCDIYTVGQQLCVTPLVDGLDIKVECGINTKVTNLNEISSEPFPVQPGRKQFEEIYHDADIAEVQLHTSQKTKLAFGQIIDAAGAEVEKKEKTYLCSIKSAAGECVKISKLVAMALSPLDGAQVAEKTKERMDALQGYGEVFETHCSGLRKWWKNTDIDIQGADADQLALRYSMLQLMQSCPRHTSRVSIGARGLTGEMYEGCVFWDTEIFMLPFFTLTSPDNARKLLEFRYKTLPKAREHAENNWFSGAMYGWQVNAQGVEQTPKGVGAYYSIHVVADIAFAIQDYYYCTGDNKFILDMGLEILLETARFWAGRVTMREDNKYEIIAVRGPNEYDVLVNNNLYTNMMARENLQLCRRLWNKFSQSNKQETDKLRRKLNLCVSELKHWEDIEANILLPFEEKQNLWLEDDTYLRRKSVDMQKAKPTGKRIIDTTIPYEALPFYQVSKQADVLHVMKNLPWHFTKDQVQAAYHFYKPRTAFDSSLAYSMFSIMAARLNMGKEALEYFDTTANLDIRNVQLNTISGLHFANFGGAWQAVVFGFGGVQVSADALEINPCLPPGWKKLAFKLWYQEALIMITLKPTCISVSLLAAGNKPVSIVLCGQSHCLKQEGDKIEVNR